MASQEEQNALIAQMAQITSASPDQVSPFLLQAEWDLQTALETFYTAHTADDPIVDPDVRDQEPDTSDLTNTHGYGGTTGRTLGGEGSASRAVPSSSAPGRPIPTASSSTTRKAASSSSRGGMRTLRDLQASADPGHGHPHDDDDMDDDDDDDDKDQDMFAGGEKSGLAVQNPNSARSGEDHIDQILRRAAQNRPRPGGDDDEPAARPSHFRGQGQTLGGDDAPSTLIPPQSSSSPAANTTAPRVHRELHLWRNGFSVDDGELFRFDDPANAAVLEMINRGRAPLDLLGVEQGQEVDLQVHPHRDEDFKPPKKKYKPFGGEGQRLGAPTPAPSGTAASSSASTTAQSSTSTPSSTTAQSGPTVDESAPTITLQIRLGDGTSLRSRFNTTHTIGDIYNFVNSASTASTQRGYALMTTFPSKELNDKTQVLGDMAEFKRGGVVVQKWT